MIFPLLAVLAATPPSMPLRSIDSTLARKVLEGAGSAVSPAPVDDWQVLGPLPGDTAVILRQGTEVVRIRWDSRLDASTTPLVPNLADSGWGSTLRRWTDPSTGIRLSSGLATAVSPGSSPIVATHLDADFRTGWRGWVSVGANVRMEQLLSTPPIAIPLGDSIVRPVVDWGLSACGPGICLEGRTRTLPVGVESWLQPRLSDHLVARREGEFWESTADSAFPGAWETKLLAHLGAVHYSYSICPGLWKGAIQSLGLRSSQDAGASWGGGLLWTRERLASWVELGFSDIPLPLLRVRRRSIGWSPVRARLEWRT
ncbi:MAG TPA: hypothetical protein PKY05_15325, partial [Fibrobacteria bacterium]|nr:hypothetical protein [Fibrobacteria bacterium]